MTIIVFLIDTSASMNQSAFIGARPTLLDIAKGAVESFVKLRQRSPESRGDRYMLFTSEEYPNYIKAGWKENLVTFMNELKNIKAAGLSTLGPAIKNVYDVLNINRMQSGIDTYGAGRSPFYLEPSVVVLITDGGKLSSSQGIQDDIFAVPKTHPIPGAELTKEIFRWDQRLFGLVLRLTGTPVMDTMGLVPSDDSPLDKLCEQTGGRSYAVGTHRMFQQCIDSLVQKVQSGVVINFEKIGPDPPPVQGEGKDISDIIEVDKENLQMNIDGMAGGGGMMGMSTTMGSSAMCYNNGPSTSNPTSSISGTAWHNCRKMIYVPRATQRGGPSGFWPIPESFWPDITTISLPARSAHPNLKFTCTSQEPMIIENLPFDKYELEPSPLTQYILSRKQPTVCWQVYISNSSKNSDVGHPFGYLKASTNLQCVNLFVMPYNYPVLLPLLDDLFKVHRLKPTKEWKIQFDNYLRTMPPYYANPLKRALGRMGALNLVPDNLDNSLSYEVTHQLKKLKNQAKLEYERICSEVEKRVSQNNSMGVGSTSNGSSPIIHDGLRVQPRRPLSQHLISNHTIRDKLAPLRDQVIDHNNFTLSVREGDPNPQMYRNPFDIPRSQIIDQLARMRANFLQGSLHLLLTDRDQDQLHCRPIGQMGNYQDYLKKQTQPLREIESAPERQHMFGNPFKINRKMSMMVDETDVDLMGAGPGGSGNNRGNKRPVENSGIGGMRANKRRRGPLPPDVTIQRMRSPKPSPPSSPAPYRTDEMVTEVVPRVDQMNRLRNDLLLSPQPVPSSVISNLAPSPSVFTPGYPPISPPGSPAYPLEESIGQVIPNAHPLVNGDVTNNSNSNSNSNSKRDDDSDSDSEHELNIVEELPLPINRTPLVNNISGPDSPEDKALPASVVPEDIAPIVPARNQLLMADSASSIAHNKQLLRFCYKEVKRPGRDFVRLFEQLNTVQGSHDSRIRLVKEVIHEAGRFKRHSLVKLISQFLDTMGENEHNHVNTVTTMQNVHINGHSR